MIVYRAQQQEEERASACLGAIGALFQQFEQGRYAEHERAAETP